MANWTPVSMIESKRFFGPMDALPPTGARCSTRSVDLTKISLLTPMTPSWVCVPALPAGTASICPAPVSGTTVYVPCPTEIRALSIGGDSITDLWRAPVKNASSPMIGGGAVWVVDYGDGVLDELSQNDGHVVAQVSVGRSTRFTAPTLSGSKAYIGTVDSVVAVSGV